MTTIAELVIKVNTAELDRAKKSLEDLSTAAKGVDLGGIGGSGGTGGTDALIKAQDRLIAKAEKMVATVGATKGEILKYDAALRGLSSSVDPLANKFDKLASAQKLSADISKAAQKSLEGASAAQYRMIESLKEEIALFGKSKDEITLYRAGLMGIKEQVAPLVAELQRLKEAKQAELQVGKEGSSASIAARKAESSALAEEANQLERLIALKRQEAQTAKSSGGFSQTGMQAAEAEIESYTRKLEQVTLRQKATESSTEQMAKEFQQLLYSIDPAAKSLDELARKKGDLNTVFRSGFIDEGEWRRLTGIIDQKRNAVLGLGQAADAAGDEFQQLRAQIDPAAAAMDKLAAQQSKLNTLYNSGKGSLPTAEYQRLNTILAQNRQRVVDLGASTGKTAKEMNFALRGLPAQFTDIFVSLQGGQAPLTVLLQQGGQLKDMFGGIGPALRVMGSYIVGLINPVTVLAAAVGVMAVSWAAAEAEVSAFKNATVEGKGFSGAALQDLQSYRNEIDAVVGTAGQAAQALTLLQASGRVSASAFVDISEAAIKMQRATGVAIEDTVRDFVSLGKDPVNAAIALDDKYKTLTSSTISYAQELVSQGRSQEASTFLMTEMARESAKTADEMIRNASTTKTAWQGLKDIIGETWDAIKSPFEDSVLTEEIAKLKKEIKDIEDGKGILGFLKPDTAFREFRLNMLQAQLDQQKFAAKSKKDSEDIQRAAASVAAQNAQNYAQNLSSLDAVAAAEADLTKVKSNRIKLENAAIREKRALTAEEEKFQKAAEDAAQKRLDSAIESQNKKDKSAVVRQDAAQKLLATILQQGAALQEQVDSQGKAFTEESKLAKLKEEIRQAEEASILGIATLDQQSLVSQKEGLILAQRKNVELQKSIKSKEAEAKLDALQAELQAEIAANEKKYADALVGAGRGKAEIERMKQRNALEDEYAKKVKELNRLKLSGDINEKVYKKQIAAQKKALETEKRNLEKHYRDMDDIRGNWVNGATSAWEDYLDGIRDVSSQSYDLFTNAFKGIEDYLVSFISGTKASFSDLVKSIAADFARLAVRNTIGSIFGINQGGGSGGGSGGGGGGSGFGDIFSAGRNAYSIYQAATGQGFLGSIVSGFQSGGLGGAFSGGTGYLSNAASGLYSAGASLFGGGGAAASGAAAQAAGAAAGNSLGVNAGVYAAQGGGGGVLGGIGAAAGPIAAAYAAFSAYNAYKDGVRLDPKDTRGNAAAWATGFQPLAELNGLVSKLTDKLGIGGALGNILNIPSTLTAMVGSALFGGGWQTKNAGLALAVQGGELDAKSYEYQKKKGGLFGKNKSRTRYSALDPKTDAAFKETFAETREGVEDLFEELGFTMEEGTLSGLTLARKHISTVGKTEEEIQTSIAEWFGTAAEAMNTELNKVFGTGLDYDLAGMQAFVGNLKGVNAVLESLRLEAYEANVAGGKLAESLSAVAGGLELLSTNTQTYYEQFFTPLEKFEDQMKAITSAFKEADVEMVNSREAYRAMVEDIDLTTDAGQAMFATMMQLSGTAAQYFEILESQADQAAQAAAQLLTNNVSSAFGSLQRSANVERDRLTKNYQAQIAAEQAAAAARSSAYADMIATARESVQSLERLDSALNNTLKTLLSSSDTAVEMMRQQAVNVLKTALQMARSGKSLAGVEGLEDALDAASNLDMDIYGSLEDFEREQWRTANLVAELEKINGEQLSADERLLLQLEASAAAIQAGIESVTASLTAEYERAIKALDDELAAAQSQLDALNGIDNSVQSVASAVAQMSAAVTAAMGGQAAAIQQLYQSISGSSANQEGVNFWLDRIGEGGNYTELIQELQQASQASAGHQNAVAGLYRQAGTTADAQGIKFWTEAIASGTYTYDDLRNGLGLKSPKLFATGGAFTGQVVKRPTSFNMGVMGEAGPEAILPLANVGGSLGVKAVTDGTAEEVKGLREEVGRLGQMLYQITKNTARSADELINMSENGLYTYQEA